MATIAFIGLGHMGLPMALNLLKAGHQVIGYDVQESAVTHFARLGGLTAKNIGDAAADKDIIITMLQTGDQVLQVCPELLDHAQKNTLYIDCSTIDVASSRKVHQLATEKNLLVLDAPVSGGVASASAGTLTFIVGGEESTYTKALPILSAMGKKIIHTGAAGSGQAAKICNNMVLGISMIAISEAFLLGEQLGLSAQKLFEVVSNASGQCWVMDKYVPVPGVLEHVPANSDYKPGFAAAMMLKDLMLGHQSAKTADLTLPLGSKACELYQEFINQGCGNLDFSAIIKLLEV
ncbi:MAG: 3-hydroxyisobutyrate dehydrogenase [Legionella sp.]|jgi:3-hydroxyisobutyrate dehydrogenase